MKHLLLPIASLAAILTFAGNFVAQSQLAAPAIPLQRTRDVAAHLEAKIARLEVERLGLLVEYTPLSQPVATANQKLLVLRRELAELRPGRPKVGVAVQRKTTRSKIAQLETVSAYLSARNDKSLDAERKYVANYLAVLRSTCVASGARKTRLSGRGAKQKATQVI